jgi:hypothetical protein
MALIEFDDRPDEILELASVKTTCTRSWQIYWNRRNLKWHRYDPVPEDSCLQGD